MNTPEKPHSRSTRVQTTPRAGDPLESEIQAAILQYLATREDLRAWRNNVGVGVLNGGHHVRFGVPGQADISGILAGGRRLEIEVKRPDGRQSEQQRRFQAMVERFGGVYILARSVGDVRSALDKALGKEAA